jgi:hypothetical protein
MAPRAYLQRSVQSGPHHEILFRGAPHKHAYFFKKPDAPRKDRIRRAQKKTPPACASGQEGNRYQIGQRIQWG